MKLKLISTLAGAALALGLLAQSDFAAAALGCKYQEALNLPNVTNGKIRFCQDVSANGSAVFMAVLPGARRYGVGTELLKADAFSSRMRLLNAAGGTNGCDLVDQLVDKRVAELLCNFPNNAPAVTFLFNAGDSVGP